jgi:predicted extracellular nuclease
MYAKEQLDVGEKSRNSTRKKVAKKFRKKKSNGQRRP